jgi:transposase InsO family protein/transposase-like protein
VYKNEQKSKALALHQQCKSVGAVIQQLEYPSRQTLYAWIGESKQAPKAKTMRKRINNPPNHPQHPSVELKLSVIHRCFELGENVQLVSEEAGYSRASIYIWRRTYMLKGAAGLMNHNDDPRGELPSGEPASSKEGEALKAQICSMQMEIDVLKETLNVLKKDPGVNVEALRNQEKAAVIDALTSKYQLPRLLKSMRMPRSSYYYCELAVRRDKYAGMRAQILRLWRKGSERYGYRRIHGLLRREGARISEKAVRRLMRELGLEVKCRRKIKKYSSYKGEITPAVPNVIARNFHAGAPNKKWLTDITEFAIPAGKVYLSPIVDCFDGMLPAWRISTSPDAALVNGMLEDALSTLSKNECPLIHTDRGCHYRWPGWTGRMENAGLQRSMSKKGCSPDNSACEGFFGRLKNEMFYSRSWADISLTRFCAIINDYLVWYNNERIKTSLGNMSPLEFRQSLGLAA